MGIELIGLAEVPEVREGDDLARLIRQAAGPALDASAVLVVAQKVVSKAEGAVVDLCQVQPGPLACQWAAEWQRDPRLIELVLRESRRIVRMDRGVLIAETHHGLVAANAGVDQSNVPGEHLATVLPRDPDASARRLWQALGCGAVVVSDTFGRPWREGLVNVAIGVAGLEPLEDLRGCPDRTGKTLRSTVIAIADELAAAAGLLMRKAAGVPAVVIRPAERDLFR